MKSRVLIAGLVVAATAAPALSEDKRPEIVAAEMFCTLHGGGDQRPVEYLLTKSLLAMIHRAQMENDEIQTAAPDEKPPLGDGVPYQSFPDVAPICRPGEAIANSDVTAIFIDYVFPDTPDANWTDRLRLKWEDGLLRIDDIRYGPDHESGLRKTLAEVFPE